MSKLINGDYSFAYPNFLGNQKLTSDMIIDSGTTNTIEQTLLGLESNSGSLTGDIVIGSTFSNIINVNSGSTTYNNNEIIKLKDNTVGALKYQCNDGGLTDLLSINTTNGAEKILINKNFQVMGDFDGVNCYFGTITATGDINSNGFKSNNITDSISTTTGAIITTGGVGIAKNVYIGENLNVGGSVTTNHLISTGSVQGVGIASTGNIQAYANSIYGGNIISSGSITTGNNVGIIFSDASSVPCKIYNKNAVGMTFNYNNTDYGFLNNNGLTLYPSLINLGYNTSSGNATIRMGSNLRKMVEYDVTNDITYINAGLSVNKIGISNVLNTFGASNNTGFLNTSETTSATDTNASVYCAGGMAVAKKLYVGGALNVGTNTITSGTINSSGNVNCGLLSPQNVILPTTGGIATSLKYYEEYTTLVNNWAPNSGGPWLNTTNTMTLIRIGNIVNLKIKAFSGDAMGSFIHNFAVIPSRFCPPGSAQFPIQVINVSTTQLGLLSVLSTGYTNIYSSITSSNFNSGIGSGLLVDTFVSWTMI